MNTQAPQITTAQEVPVHVTFTDSAGNVLTPQTALDWTSSNAGVADVLPDATDPYLAVVGGVSAGTASVTVKADFSINGQTVEGTGTFDIQVNPDGGTSVVNVEFTFGDVRNRS